MILLILLLVASVSDITVIEETVAVPAGAVKGLNLVLQQARQRRAVIDVAYQVLAPGGPVTVGLIGPGDAASGASGQPHQYLRMIPDQDAGAFRFPAANAGVYQVILDNRGNAAGVKVGLTVKLRFGEAGTAAPGTLSWPRKMTAIGLSALFFLAVCWWSGRKLISAVRRRPPDVPPPLF